MPTRAFITEVVLVAALAAYACSGARRALGQDSPSPEHDVSNVRFRGDSTIMKMKVGTADVSAHGFRIETTGARFEYASGGLRVYQGLAEPRRLVATITLAGAPAFELGERNEDHALLWSADVNLGFYGDSTLILAPKAALDVRCVGNFKPDYEAKHRGELLLIDGAGGLSATPQRYGPEYELRELELGKRDWTATYGLPVGQKLMVAAFPGRPFDWEKSFHRHMVMTYGSMGLGTGNAYGEMPPEEAIATWARTFDIVYLSFEGLYERVPATRKYPHPGGPYTIANPVEFRRFVASAHRQGLKVVPYVSGYYCVERGGAMDEFFAQVGALKHDFQVAGVYVDGLLTDTKEVTGRDDKIGSWETARRLRQVFGADGALVLHGTAIGNEVGVLPNVDTYFDVTIYGEGVVSHSLQDPYLLYRVRKYGISNTVGIWYGSVQGTLSWPERLRTILALNCRMRWGAAVPVHEAPPVNRYVWNTKLDWWYLSYRRGLREMEDRYRRGLNPMGEGLLSP